MAPKAEANVIGRHGVVYSHDTIGTEANTALETIEQQQVRIALGHVRSTAEESIEEHGLVAMADMRIALSQVIMLHEQLNSLSRAEITLEDVTAAYLGKLTEKIIEDKKGEISEEDCMEYFTGLSALVPELHRVEVEEGVAA